MGLYNHALWQVAVKALLFQGDGKLLTLTTPDGYLDFPGGRVDETERTLAWAESLRREVAEELGDAVRFELGRTAFVSRPTLTRAPRTTSRPFISKRTIRAGTSHYLMSTPSLPGLIRLHC